MNIVIIGLGGIGSILCEKLARFLNHIDSEDEQSIILVDGDEYEIKNKERQEFNSFGNKAEVKASELAFKFDNIEYDYFTEYVDPDNVSKIIESGDIVFMCVDNHKTRKIINNYCKTLANVTLISGGNELTDGNVQLYVRKGGEDLTPDLCAYHPEIADPDDKLPTEMSCEELSQSEPQLYFTNLSVATLMCWMFFNSVINDQHEKSEVYFDMITMTSDAKTRVIK